MTNLLPHDQFVGLCVLDFINDLFTASSKETFSRVDVLIVLNQVKNDPEFFDPQVVELYEEGTSHIGEDEEVL